MRARIKGAIYPFVILLLLAVVPDARAGEPTLSRDTGQLALELYGAANKDLGELQRLVVDPAIWEDPAIQNLSLRRIGRLQGKVEKLMDRVERATEQSVEPGKLVILTREALDLARIILATFNLGGLAEPAGTLGDAVNEALEEAAMAINGEIVFKFFNFEIFCFDGLDNDNDGLIDGDDPDC